MKTLHRYLLRQVVASLALTVAVFTMVLLLGSVLKEVLPLLISQKAAFGLVTQAVGLLIPYVASFALPIGMLTASLLVFGRFSADQELTAARASGISLLSLTVPIVLFSILLCGISLVVNLEIAPRCRAEFKNLVTDVKTALMDVQLPEGRVITDFPGFIIYTAKNRKQQLQDVRIFRLANKTNIEETIVAPRGRIEKDYEAKRIVLHLYNAQGVSHTNDYMASSKEIKIPINFGEQRTNRGELKISDMTFTQLMNKLRDLEKLQDLQADSAGASSAENISAPESQDRQRRSRKGSKDIPAVIRMQIHRQWAFSFACFGFTLVGIPLGIRMHRRETNIGIVIALGLLAIYYALIIVADLLSSHPELMPHLWMWLPNFLFQAVGAFLLWRANRGS